MKRRDRESERMTNRAVLSKERGRYTVKRGNGGPGVYKEKEEERGGIRFKNKQVREGRARWRTKMRQIRRRFP